MTHRWTLAIVLVTALFTPAAGATEPRRKVIIDQDAYGPAGSNLQAILMIVQSPDMEVLGVTVESGDGWQRENVAHALRMLELIGRPDIPVVPGSTYPLLNSEEETLSLIHIFGHGIPSHGFSLLVSADRSRPIQHPRFVARRDGVGPGRHGP